MFPKCYLNSTLVWYHLCTPRERIKGVIDYCMDKPHLMRTHICLTSSLFPNKLSHSWYSFVFCLADKGKSHVCSPYRRNKYDQEIEYWVDVSFTGSRTETERLVRSTSSKSCPFVTNDAQESLNTEWNTGSLLTEGEIVEKGEPLEKVEKKKTEILPRLEEQEKANSSIRVRFFKSFFVGWHCCFTFPNFCYPRRLPFIWRNTWTPCSNTAQSFQKLVPS